MNRERYIRQTVLSDFGREAQQKLTQAKVLVVGAGGLGIPVVSYLNAMGVGTLGIVDGDTISLSNLHRQVLYDESEIGQSKVAVALRKLEAQNSDTQLIGHKVYLRPDNALDIIGQYDVVVDASDNFPTRYLINDACVILKKPLVYGALHSFEGQVSVFNYKNGPTYRCLFPNMPKKEEVPNCNDNGVLGVIPGIVGNLQALETIKLIAGVGEVLSGKLLLYNGLNQSFQKIKFSVDPENLKVKELKSNYDFECAPGITSIETEAFVRLLENQKIKVVDVRTPEEYHSYHLEHSINIPLSEVEQRLHEIEFDTSVYFICQSGVRSRKAITLIGQRRPNGSLINVDGGINNMKEHVST